MSKVLFSTFDVARILGLHRERLRPWIENDYIMVYRRAKGLGTKSKFTKRNIQSIAIFEMLLNAGFTRRAAAKAIRSIDKYSGHIYLTKNVGVRINLKALKKNIKKKIDDYTEKRR